MNKIIVARTTDYRWATLPNSCQKDSLFALCRSIYIPCSNSASSISIGSSSYYLNLPCDDLCFESSLKCIGLAPIYGIGVNCSSSINSQLEYFSKITNVSITAPVWTKYANIFESCVSSSKIISDRNALIVADMKEMYFSSNASYRQILKIISSGLRISNMERYIDSQDWNGSCHGIIGEFFVPLPQNTISGTIFPSVTNNFDAYVMAPIRPSLYVQAFLESITFNALWNQVPLWVSPQCFDSIRYLTCRTTFLATQDVSVYSVLKKQKVPFNQLQKYLGVNISAWSSMNYSLPSYPLVDICHSYRDKCADYLTFNSSHFLQLNSFCKYISEGYLGYSVNSFLNNSQSQIVMSIAVQKAPVSLTLPFSTAVSGSVASDRDNIMSSSTCPRGYDFLDSIKQVFFKRSGSSCALKCYHGLWDDSHWISYQVFLLIFAALGIIGFVLSIPFAIVIWNPRDYLFGLCIILCGALSLLMFAVVCQPLANEFCFDKFVLMPFGNNFCTFQSFCLVFLLLAISSIWFFLVVEIMLKIHFRSFAVHWLRQLSLFVIIVVPLCICSVFVYYQRFGYRFLHGLCLFSGNFQDLEWIFVLLLLFFVLMGISSQVFLYFYYRKIQLESSIPSKFDRYIHGIRIIRSNRGRIQLCWVFLMIWIPVVCYFLLEPYSFQNITETMDRFSRCVFEHSSRFDRDQWIVSCGRFPKKFYFIYGLMFFVNSLLSLQPWIIVAFNYYSIQLCYRQLISALIKRWRTIARSGQVGLQPLNYNEDSQFDVAVEHTNIAVHLIKEMYNQLALWIIETYCPSVEPTSPPYIFILFSSETKFNTTVKFERKSRAALLRGASHMPLKKDTFRSKHFGRMQSASDNFKKIASAPRLEIVVDDGAVGDGNGIEMNSQCEMSDEDDDFMEDKSNINASGSILALLENDEFASLLVSSYNQGDASNTPRREEI